MRQPNMSDRVPIDVPAITSTISLGELYKWLTQSTQTIVHGRVGLEFRIQDGVIVAYEPIYRPSIRPKQIVADDMAHILGGGN